MFITAKSLDDEKRTVLINTDYITRIEKGGIIYMEGTVRQFKTDADSIQRLLVDMILTEKRLGIGTQHYTREIAREIAEEVDDGEQQRVQAETKTDSIKQAHKSATGKA